MMNDDKELKIDIEKVFPPGKIRFDRIEDICINLENEEFFESSFSFINKSWEEISCSVWSNHSSFLCLSPKAVAAFLPSLLYCFKINPSAAMLPFEAFLYSIDENFCSQKIHEKINSGKAIGAAIKCRMSIIYEFNLEQIDFIISHLKNIPCGVVFDFDMSDELSNAISFLEQQRNYLKK